MPLSTASIAPVKVGIDGAGTILDLAAAITQAAQAGGDAFFCQGKEVLFVQNGGGAPITVTIKAVADNFGNVLSGNDIVVSVAAGKTAVIGAVTRSKFADTNSLAQVTYSAVTTVTIKLLTFATSA